MERAIEVTGETIRLGQLLKLAGVAEDGADAKALVQAGEVSVNGEREERRGRQLRDGDLVAVGDETLRVRAARD